jgi:hypothetical protein
MALSVDNVYKTVLLILNKEQRGYMTPEEFNKTATQVQLEIYNQTFEDYNQLVRQQQPDTGTADRILSLETKLSPFRSEFTPTSYGAGYIDLPSNFYRLDTIIYTISGRNNLAASSDVELQQVTRSELYNLKLSSLTDPTEEFPVFTFKNESSSIKRINVFPDSVGTNGNKADIFYFIVPSDIEWAFTTGSLGQYEYDANNSVQFLLTEDEFTNIVKRILLYSGIIVRDPQIVQAAAAQIQKEEVQEKS